MLVGHVVVLLVCRFFVCPMQSQKQKKCRKLKTVWTLPRNRSNRCTYFHLSGWNVALPENNTCLAYIGSGVVVCKSWWAGC